MATLETHPLVGRESELDALDRLVQDVQNGMGRLVLLSGEAGCGKTRLAEAVLREAGFSIAEGRLRQGSNAPYAPLVNILRQCLANVGTLPTKASGFVPYLSMLMPELGDPPAEVDQGTLVEAICSVLVSEDGSPLAVFLDDLHWADNATLEILPALVDRLHSSPVLLLATYRSDDITRGHPIRRLRNELRRARKLHEIEVGPLSRDVTATLIQQALGVHPSDELTNEIHERTQGVPLFVEELIRAIEGAQRVTIQDGVAELVAGVDVPLPETVRDAILLRLDDLSPEARELLELAAVCGMEFQVELIRDLSEDDNSLDELFERNLLVESSAGMVAFRHFLICESVRVEIPWSTRRTLHRQVAAWLRNHNASPEQTAEHWLAANEPVEARSALMESAERSCRIHAYRDAATAAHQALELWPSGEDEDSRLCALERFASCAQIGGRLDDAVRAWRELLESRTVTENPSRRANALRSLATVYGLQGAWEHSNECREKAARAFEEAAQQGEAAVEWLALGGRQVAAIRLAEAEETITHAARLAREAHRDETYVRARSLLAYTIAQRGRAEDGRATAEEALAFALKRNLTVAASDALRRLAGTLEYNSDYDAARDAYVNAHDFCKHNQISVQAELCLGCMSWILFRLGDWKRSLEVCREVASSDNSPVDSRAAALSVAALIHAHRGETRPARKNLEQAIPLARQSSALIIHLLSIWGLAVTAEYEGNDDNAAAYYDDFLTRWEKTQDRHDVLPALFTAATFFSSRHNEPYAARCTGILSALAGETGNPEALAVLEYAMAKTTADLGETVESLSHFERALQLFKKLDLPLEVAQVEFSLGQAKIAAGRREEGSEHMLTGYRLAKKLGARPRAAHYAQALADLGVTVAEERDASGAQRSTRAGLTRRQLEVARYLADGLTNKEIAEKLFVSPRTVDMHVSHIFDRLDVRTRAEAVRRLAELELLA